MSREIKFRAWNTEKKIMCYDNEDESAELWDGAYGSEVGMINEYLNLPKHLKTYEYMQYIGVNDKNGKEIYERDIVKTKFFGKDDGKGHNFNDYDLFEITYIAGSFVLENKTRQFSASYLADMSGSGAAEVVGNVYENADLLEGFVNEINRAK